MKNFSEQKSVASTRRAGLSALVTFAAAHLMSLPAAAQVSQETLDSISTPDQVET
jgi:hypothetical protein